MGNLFSFCLNYDYAQERNSSSDMPLDRRGRACPQISLTLLSTLVLRSKTLVTDSTLLRRFAGRKPSACEG